MTLLKRMAQVLPPTSYKPSCSYQGRTKLISHHRPGLAPSLFASQRATSSIKRFSMSHAIHSSSAGQSASQERPYDIIYSSGQPADLPDRVLMLLSKWQLTESKKGLKQDFVFPSFSKAWRFMDTVAGECKAKNHHPSWSNMYNEVTVEWTTHRPEGLSIKDVEMAEFCDQTASQIGLKK